MVRDGDTKSAFFNGVGARERAATTTFDRFLQLAFTGVRFGLIIGITSIGLSLIFGTTGLTNFAHGEMVTFGGIIAWYVNVSCGLHIIPATVIAVIAGAGPGRAARARHLATAAAPRAWPCCR